MSYPSENRPDNAPSILSREHDSHGEAASGQARRVPTSPASKLGAALEYARRGWPVFPLRRKQPLTKHGLKDASRNEATLSGWWARWRDADIGMATGTPSGLVVIDLDTHGGATVEALLRGLEGKFGPIPETPRAHTGGGGLHVFFQHPGFAIRNRAGFLDNIDVRGDGGYIVAPPSAHASGGTYRWDERLHPDCVPLAPLPAALCEALKPKPRRPASVTGHPPKPLDQRAARWAGAAFEAELAKVRCADEGKRNDTLNSAAFAVGQIVGWGALDRDRAERELLVAAKCCGLPELEAESTIRSGLDAGAQNPRGPAEQGPPPASAIGTDPVPSAKPARAERPRRTQGGDLSLEEIEPSAEAVDGLELHDELVATLKRYVVLPAHAAVVIALWITMTYLADVVDVLPRLLLTSPTRACGKSKLLALIGALVHRALPASSITPSALFRAIEAGHPTLLLDEMDNARLNESDELRAILNSGHTRGTASVLRTVGDGHEVRRFSTLAPLAFAGIGRLPDTVASRCVQVPMRRKLASEKLERLRESRIGANLEPKRRRLARWANDHAAAIAEAEPAVPDSLGDRDADNWTPLLAIAAQVGGDWPEQARRAALALSGVADEDAAGPMLLSDLREFFEAQAADRSASNPDRVTTDAALRHLNAMDTRPWPEWSKGKSLTARGLARLLAPFGIEPGGIRLDDGSTPKGYKREWFEDAWGRYLPPLSATAPQPAADAGETPVPYPQRGEAVAEAESGSDPHEHWPCGGVADTKPEDGTNGEWVPLDLPSGSDEADRRRREADIFRGLGGAE